MDFARGYALSRPERDRLRLIDWIADNGGDVAGRTVDLDFLFDSQDESACRNTAAELRAMRDEGLINLSDKMSWASWKCQTTPAGVRLTEQLRRLRRDMIGRHRAARDALLRWLADCTVNGSGQPNTADFPTSDYGIFYGDPFSDREIGAATEWLREEGLLKGASAWGAGMVRPSITPKGLEVVEQGRSVSYDVPEVAHGLTTITHITGSYNTIATNSPGAVQRVSVTMTQDLRRQLGIIADNLEGLVQRDLLGLNEQTSVEAETIVSDLRAAAEQEDLPSSTLQQILNKTKTVAIAGTGAAMGQGVVALVDQALKALGLG